MATSTTEERFNVVCINCSNVWSPQTRSRLWWKAKNHADNGYLDALHVTAEECGCVKEKREPNAPYRVFGFDDMCREFDIPFTSLSDAVKEYLDASRGGLCTVFIQGVSPKVEAQLASL